MENIERIESIYHSVFDNIYNVYEIFKEYYGESKVDLQDVVDKKRFIKDLATLPIINYINKPFDIIDSKWARLSTKKISELSDIEYSSLDNIAYNLKLDTFGIPFILVHWPHVRITNDNDRSVDISHLYAKIVLCAEGTIRGKFTLNRAEYSLSHLQSNYMHSHVSSIPTEDFTKFKSPCTGSGPINDTICSLSRNYNEELWRLFCLELDKYVHTESLEGGPYHKLEQIGINSTNIDPTTFDTINSLPYNCSYLSGENSTDKWNKFFRYFIEQRKLKFNYTNGSYSIGMSYVDYIMTITDSFISWYNDAYNRGEVRKRLDSLIEKNLIKKCIVANNKIVSSIQTSRIFNWKNYEGQLVCMFKKKRVVIHITNTKDFNVQNESLILNHNIAMYILTRILKVLNYRYGRNKETREEGNAISSEIYFI